MRLPFVFIIIFISISCQRQITSPPNPQGTQEVKLLSKITYFEPGSSFVDSFEFDAQHRCTRLVKIWRDSSINLSDYISFYRFHYNGADTQPFKITDTSDGRRMAWYILYDAQGRKIVDSIDYFAAGQKHVTHYTYSPQMITCETKSTSSSYNNTVKDTFDLVGGNCTRSKSAMQDPTSTYSSQYIFTFDTHINPISKLNIANSVLFGAATPFSDVRGISKNNITTSIFSNTGNSSTSLMTTRYEYDVDDYPLLGKTDGGPSVVTTKFDYK